MEKEYIVVGDNNFWYATFKADTKWKAQDIFEETIEEIESGKFSDAENLAEVERVYLYEAKEVEVHDFEN